MDLFTARSVLGVSRGADAAAVKEAYRRLAREHHPDRGGQEADFVRVQEAYDTLTGPTLQQGPVSDAAADARYQDLLRETAAAVKAQAEARQRATEAAAEARVDPTAGVLPADDSFGAIFKDAIEVAGQGISRFLEDAPAKSGQTIKEKLAARLSRLDTAPAPEPDVDSDLARMKQRIRDFAQQVSDSGHDR
jgi:DnaJ-class molecular chaperone